MHDQTDARRAIRLHQRDLMARLRRPTHVGDAYPGVTRPGIDVEIPAARGKPVQIDTGDDARLDPGELYRRIVRRLGSAIQHVRSPVALRIAVDRRGCIAACTRSDWQFAEQAVRGKRLFIAEHAIAEQVGLAIRDPAQLHEMIVDRRRKTLRHGRNHTSIDPQLGRSADIARRVGDAQREMVAARLEDSRRQRDRAGIRCGTRGRVRRALRGLDVQRDVAGARAVANEVDRIQPGRRERLVEVHAEHLDRRVIG